MLLQDLETSVNGKFGKNKCYNSTLASIGEMGTWYMGVMGKLKQKTVCESQRADHLK
jgi:hypothetical protein